MEINSTFSINLHDFCSLDGVEIEQPPYETDQPRGLFMTKTAQTCLFLPIGQRTARLVFDVAEEPVQSSGVMREGDRYSLMSLVLTQEGNLGEFNKEGSFFCYFQKVRQWLDQHYSQLVSSQSARELDPLSEEIVTADLFEIQSSVLRVWISRIQNFLFLGRLPYYLSKTRASFNLLSEYNELVHALDTVSDFIRNYQRYYEALFRMMHCIDNARKNDSDFFSKSKDEVNAIMRDFLSEIDELEHTNEILVHLFKFRTDVRRFSRILASDLRDSILSSSFEHTERSFLLQLGVLVREFRDVFSDPELQPYLMRDIPFKFPPVLANPASSKE
ncbi:hypothetical protein HYV57_05065 [Candidatus Peregrinibacteria bacterium]|nr:hypothetical protein [Candidatus Peregrinibacteria bacterium]